MNRSLFVPIFASSLLLSTTVFAQQSRITYTAELQAIGTTGGVVPFWMRSNQYGSIPLSGASSSFLASAKKEYDINSDGYFGKPKLIDWGMGIEGRVNSNISRNQFILTEAYLKGRLGPFQLKAGRSKETMGLTGDTALSSGSFSVSGNALGIPKIEISIPEYYTFPLFDSLFAVKGDFAHGWLGRVRILDKNQDVNGKLVSFMQLTHPKTYLHQKSFYGRFGKPSWGLKLSAGFNHQVFWGNERKSYGDIYELSNFQTFLYVVTGSAYGSGAIPRSKIGNQLGSIDLGFEYDFKYVKVTGYRQNLYDVGALYYLANFRDGLTGISLANKRHSNSKVHWKKFLLEFFYSKNQAGELWSIATPSGDEDYYNNYYYREGWSYKSLGLGNPLISTKSSARTGLPSYPGDYFINNRVIALHMGVEAQILKWNYQAKATYSHNYGTFGTSTTGHSTGKVKIIEPRHGLFGTVKQVSVLVEGRRKFKNNLDFAYAVALDRGRLLYDSEGIQFKLNKRF